MPPEVWDEDEFEPDEDDPEGPQACDLSGPGDEYVPCPECGRMVYDEAQQCPHCGAWIMADRAVSSPVQRWVWVAVAALLIVLILLFSL